MIKKKNAYSNDAIRWPLGISVFCVSVGSDIVEHQLGGAAAELKGQL
jgi:hypothetical protein